MSDRSKPGLFLSGQPMPAPGPRRKRPFGCVAVVTVFKGGARIDYERDADQEALDREENR